MLNRQTFYVLFIRIYPKKQWVKRVLDVRNFSLAYPLFCAATVVDTFLLLMCYFIPVGSENPMIEVLTFSSFSLHSHKVEISSVKPPQFPNGKNV